MGNPAFSYFAGWSQEKYQAFSARLARYAAKWLARYRLIYGQGSIPGGKTVEDLVADAVGAVLEERRPWDPQRHPDLEKFIKMVIVSEVRNLFKGKERWLVTPLVLPEERETAGIEPSAVAHAGVTEETLVSPDPTPNDRLESEEKRIRATSLVHLLRQEVEASVRRQEDRDDMEYILMALVEENDTPEEIESATGIPRDRIYKLLERLRTLAYRGLKRLPDETEAKRP